MVLAVRSGQSLRGVASRYGVSPTTVRLWVQRAADRPLDQVNWEDGSHAPARQANQTPQEIQTRILTLRDELARNSDLGEYGAQAIRSSLLAQEDGAAPSV